MGMQAYAAIVSTVVAVTAVITFIASFWTARSANQRALRDRLRKQLREINLACHVYFQREGWQAVDHNPQFSFQALDQIHEDGLLSPSRSHVKRLKSILRDLRGRTELRLPKQALSANEIARLATENELRSHIAFKSLDADAQKYLRALGKMDNAGLGGYWTYLRYRLIRARPYIN